MSISGEIRGGMIVPDQPLALPEGTRVRIEVDSETQEGPGGPANPRRQGGWWRGQISVAKDFDELPADIAEAFGADSP